MNALEFISTMDARGFIRSTKGMDKGMRRVLFRGRALEEQQKRIGSFKMNLAKTTAFGAGLGLFLKEGADFERQLDVATSKMAGVNKGTQAYNKLKNTIKELGSTTEKSNVEVTGIVNSLAMAGVKVDEMSKKDLKAMVNFSIAGDTDAQQAADIITNIQSSLGGSFQELSDKIIQTTTSSNTNIEMMGETLKYAGASAKMAGQDTDTVFALAGALGNIGIQGSMAGTAMGRFFNNIAKNQDKFKSLGIEIEKNGKMRNAVDVFKDLIQKTEGMGQAKKLNIYTKLFGEQGKRVAGVNLKELDKMLKLIKNSTGTTNRVAKKMHDNLTGDILSLSSAFSGLKTEVYDALEEPLRSVIHLLNVGVSSMSGFVKEHQFATKWIIMLAGGVLAYRTAMAGAIAVQRIHNLLLMRGKAIGAVGMIIKMTKAIKSLTVAQRILNLVQKANPFMRIGALALTGGFMAYDYLKGKKEEEEASRLETDPRYAAMKELQKEEKRKKEAKIEAQKQAEEKQKQMVEEKKKKEFEEKKEREKERLRHEMEISVKDDRVDVSYVKPGKNTEMKLNYGGTY